MNFLIKIAFSFKACFQNQSHDYMDLKTMPFSLTSECDFVIWTINPFFDNSLLILIFTPNFQFWFHLNVSTSYGPAPRRDFWSGEISETRFWSQSKAAAQAVISCFSRENLDFSPTENLDFLQQKLGILVSHKQQPEAWAAQEMARPKWGAMSMQCQCNTILWLNK